MTRLNWDNVGERFYEMGVDHGVLYVGGAGYAWSGLVSVSESPNGGEARPFYLDGFKYANVASAEEFNATIQAFSAPREFGPCDGTLEIYGGLIATQQPRRPFGFSYRTKVGNDTDGNEHGFKIHLVYNALAAPSQRNNTSLGQENAPQTLSWAITTMAPRMTGLRPTAHFIIDSRNTDEALLEDILDLLYGTDTIDPKMPTVGELMALFGAPVYDAGDENSNQFTTILDAGGA
jgi:hypothetical protein